MIRPVLDIQGLRTAFGTPGAEITALDGIDLVVNRGEIVGLAGESGSGKSLTGFAINGLISAPGRVTGGQVLFDGTDLLTLPPEAMRRVRGKRISMIFQDPMMTLNPVLRIETQMRDALRAHIRISRAAARDRCVAALEEVGIAAPAERMRAYPHQLSGGMRQRVAIAIALLHGPDLVIADEPTTALDVTIQGQILAVVQRLCRDRGTALIWITHDLAVVAGIADRLAVMYAGKIVEQGPLDAVLDAPVHPYTRGLIDSVPAASRKGQLLPQIPGRMPVLAALPQGCAFGPRCAHRSPACDTRPGTREIAPGHQVRCFHPLRPSSEAAA
jgi:peptide/nickel transport system ATP-binding protein